MNHDATVRVVRAALEEDAPWGDITSDSLIPPGLAAQAVVVARQPGVVAGVTVAEAVFMEVDNSLSVVVVRGDGDPVSDGETIMEVSGSARSLLRAERIALNFLQRLSGVATLTARFVAAVEGTGVRIADTRKTTPGLRILERHAVRCGGGHNHRFSLSDAVQAKDNHLIALHAAGVDLAGAITRARAFVPHTVRIEVEVDRLDQVAAALDGEADAILLDNMTPAEMKLVVAMVAGRALLEASGGVTLETVRAIAESGVDVVSVGAITHSAPALDLALDFRVDQCGAT